MTNFYTRRCTRSGGPSLPDLHIAPCPPDTPLGKAAAMASARCTGGRPLRKDMSKKIEKKGSPRRRGSSLPRLRERVRAALVFAIPAHAPEPVVDALAIAIGMLEAVADLDGGSF